MRAVRSIRPLRRSRARSVGDLVHALGGAAQPGHPGAKALIGDAGDGGVPDGQATGQGLHRGSAKRMAGTLRPASLQVGCAIRSMTGFARMPLPWSAITASISRALHARALADSSSWDTPCPTVTRCDHRTGVASYRQRSAVRHPSQPLHDRTKLLPVQRPRPTDTTIR